MLPYNIGIESPDLCSLLANLLTNALEAAQQEMFLELKKVRETLFITVKNDYETQPVIINGKFITNKKEKSLHGWGTQIVEQIVEKYEGSVEYTVSERYFAAYVMLNERDAVR
jgi:sensor histidine kinase regulating citrate/malate metabolism